MANGQEGMTLEDILADLALEPNVPAVHHVEPAVQPNVAQPNFQDDGEGDDEEPDEVPDDGEGDEEGDEVQAYIMTPLPDYLALYPDILGPQGVQPDDGEGDGEEEILYEPANRIPIEAIMRAFIASPEYNITFPIHALINQTEGQPFEIKQGYYTIQPNCETDWVTLCGLSWTEEGIAVVRDAVPEGHPSPIITAMLTCRGDRDVVGNLPHFVSRCNDQQCWMEIWWLPNEAVILEFPPEEEGNVELYMDIGWHRLHEAIADLAPLLDVYNPAILA